MESTFLHGSICLELSDFMDVGGEGALLSYVPPPLLIWVRVPVYY